MQLVLEMQSYEFLPTLFPYLQLIFDGMPLITRNCKNANLHVYII